MDCQIAEYNKRNYITKPELDSIRVRQVNIKTPTTELKYSIGIAVKSTSERGRVKVRLVSDIRGYHQEYNYGTLIFLL